MSGLVPTVVQIYCFASIGFIMVESGRPEQAVAPLIRSLNLVTLLAEGKAPPAPADLPGMAVWVDEARIIEVPFRATLAVVEQLVQHARTSGFFSEDVARIHSWYHQLDQPPRNPGGVRTAWERLFRKFR